MAVAMALEKGLNKVIVELDCVEAVRKLKRNALDRSLVGPFVQEIKELCYCNIHVQFVWCRREANMCAHVLARAGCNVPDSEVWMESHPPMLDQLLCKDLMYLC